MSIGTKYNGESGSVENDWVWKRRKSPRWSFVNWIFCRSHIKHMILTKVTALMFCTPQKKGIIRKIDGKMEQAVDRCGLVRASTSIVEGNAIEALLQVPRMWIQQWVNFSADVASQLYMYFKRRFSSICTLNITSGIHVCLSASLRF